ncbi:PEP-CTERM sorting domain-containing protein [Paucibacter sp. APW11]|uniref:PEP-CTERM sorting domain-containing protein n=1 Tax=Roseateles aquae TaxID=3077235 RepID=A0ABU3P5E3_9BURK|nr:PEP-CTERM sorting domain-containing protein [Paucibacter sp. APW11]MDT8997787.1 PEP-CTERM sorting domain-containing protein [Paucibacter sp. APW11]
MKKSLRLLVMPAALLTVGLFAASAQAQTYRVSNYLWGEYNADTSLNFPPLGSYSRRDQFGYVYSYNTVYDTSSLPFTSTAAGTWSDTVGLGMTDVNYNIYTSTDFRHNHAKVELSGFNPVDVTTSQPFCMTDGSGACIGPTVDVDTRITNNANATAQSRWEELYYIGGASGTGVLTPTYHIDGSLGANGSITGSAQIYWAQRDFQGHTVLGLSAYYDANSDSWYKSIYDIASNSWIGSSGSGTLVLNEDLSAQLSFAYNTPFYVDSTLTTWVNGNGIADVQNTVTLTQLALPAGSRLYVASGTDYAGTAQFSGGAGTICTTQNCATGGGGGGTPPVPEPSSLAMMFSGFAALLLLQRRRQSLRKD